MVQISQRPSCSQHSPRVRIAMCMCTREITTSFQSAHISALFLCSEETDPHPDLHTLVAFLYIFSSNIRRRISTCMSSMNGEERLIDTCVSRCRCTVGMSPTYHGTCSSSSTSRYTVTAYVHTCVCTSTLDVVVEVQSLHRCCNNSSSKAVDFRQLRHHAYNIC